MNTEVGKWGNSLAVRIPAIYVKELHLEDGMEVEVTCTPDGLLLRPRKVEHTFEDWLAQIKPENRHGETEWGPAVGGEAW